MPLDFIGGKDGVDKRAGKEILGFDLVVTGEIVTLCEARNI